MGNTSKIEMRKRARMCVGLLNLLKDDVEHLRADAADFDIICLEESLKDARSTLQMLVDNVTEMEYMLYLVKSKGS